MWHLTPNPTCYVYKFIFCMCGIYLPISLLIYEALCKLMVVSIIKHDYLSCVCQINGTKLIENLDKQSTVVGKIICNCI